jgi:hypothetical protein
MGGAPEGGAVPVQIAAPTCVKRALVSCEGVWAISQPRTQQVYCLGTTIRTIGHECKYVVIAKYLAELVRKVNCGLQKSKRQRRIRERRVGSGASLQDRISNILILPLALYQAPASVSSFPGSDAKLHYN